MYSLKCRFENIKLEKTVLFEKGVLLKKEDEWKFRYRISFPKSAVICMEDRVWNQDRKEGEGDAKNRPIWAAFGLAVIDELDIDG